MLIPPQASHLPSAPAGGFRRKISKPKPRARCIEEGKYVHQGNGQRIGGGSGTINGISKAACQTRCQRTDGCYRWDFRTRKAGCNQQDQCRVNINFTQFRAITTHSDKRGSWGLGEQRSPKAMVVDRELLPLNYVRSSAMWSATIRFS